MLMTIRGVTCVDIGAPGARTRGVMDDPQLHHWEISANLGRHARPGGDGSGWLWEISRNDQVAWVVIEISEAAWSTDPVGLPEETRRALETDGRTELVKVLGHGDPPRVIRCGSTGCTYGRAGRLAEATLSSGMRRNYRRPRRLAVRMAP